MGGHEPRRSCGPKTWPGPCGPCPTHKDVKTWDMQRRALGDDNWGNWEIEDATIYNGVWLYSLLGYAEALARRWTTCSRPPK